MDYKKLELTYIIPAFVQREGNNDLHDLLNLYASYSNELIAKIHFIIVDDCSPQPVRISNTNLNYTLARVTDNIDWNQPGARNLGVHLAKTPKLILTDLDHIFPEQVLSDLLEFPVPDAIWRFRRKCQGVKVKPHPNTFYISKSTFYKTLGVDEEFSGHYGHDDDYFALLQSYLGTRFKKYRRNYIAANVHEQHNLLRDNTYNKALLERKAAAIKSKQAFKEHSRLFLNFAWEVVQESAFKPV